MRHYADDDEVDLVIIGAGAGGSVLAQRLAPGSQWPAAAGRQPETAGQARWPGSGTRHARSRVRIMASQPDPTAAEPSTTTEALNA